MADAGVRSWQDLASETGFATYEEWLTSYMGVCPYRFSRLQAEEYKPPVRCSLVDLSTCADATIAIRMSDYGNTSAEDSPTALLDALRHPTRSICLRVLLWWVRADVPITPELLDVCGLGLKIGPQFFETLADMADCWTLEKNRRRELRPFRPVSQHHTAIGNHVVTVSRDYISAQADTPPVLIVVGWDDEDWDTESDQLDVYSRQARSDWCLDETPPFQFPISIHITKNNAQLEMESAYRRSRAYANILGQLLSKIDYATIRATELPLLSMMPLLHIDTLHIRAKTSSLRRLIHLDLTADNVYNRVKEDRFWLRRHTEDSEAAKTSFMRYCRSRDEENLLHGAQYLSIDGLWRDTLHEARMFETEARDSINIQASELSLEESKKSIELSNHQIEESRRVKIITVLAFIYVPLTSVTSIYGMNIQQINGSGHDIWIFILTAAVALVTTGFSWFLIEGSIQIKAWRNRSRKAISEGQVKYGLAVRVFMIFRLIIEGHSRWAWKTNAWLRILTNSDSDFGPQHLQWRLRESRTTACEYVSHFASPFETNRTGAFSLVTRKP